MLMVNHLIGFGAGAVLGPVTSIYSQTLNANGGTLENYSSREIVAISAGANQIRVTLQSSTGAGWNVDNVGVGVQSSTYNTMATPLELKFSGASGFSIPANSSVTSDWLDFTVSAGNLVIILDHSATGGNPRMMNPGSGTNQYLLTATNSYNVATPGGTWGSDQLYVGVSLVEGRSFF